jgi:DNA repair protein RadC
MDKRYSISKPADAKRFFLDYWRQNPGNDQERFVVACLNTKNVVQSVVTVTIGTLQNSLVHPREVFKPALIEGSSGIILSHNHPSGNPTPSDQYRRVTDRLKEAGEILGINVLDHIIHGDGTEEIISLMEDL